MSIVPPDLRQYLFRRKMSCPPRNPRRFLTAVKSRSVCFRCLYFPYRCFRCPYFPYRCFRCLCFPYCYFPPDRQIHGPRCQYSAGRQWLSGFPGRCPQSSGKSPPPCHNHHSAVRMCQKIQRLIIRFVNLHGLSQSRNGLLIIFPIERLLTLRFQRPLHGGLDIGINIIVNFPGVYAQKIRR